MAFYKTGSPFCKITLTELNTGGNGTSYSEATSDLPNRSGQRSINFKIINFKEFYISKGPVPKM